jgi:hypothetical protein
MGRELFTFSRSFARRRWWSICCLAAGGLLASQAPAQNIKPAHIFGSPLPPWPGDNVPLNTQGSEAAFFDFGRHQAVIVTPNSNSPQGYSISRYDVPNGNNAHVDFSIQPSAGGVIAYSYVLNDDPQSPQLLHRFTILLPGHDLTLASPRGAGWNFTTEQTGIPDRTATVLLGTMQMVHWSNQAPASSRASGLALTLRSSYLPGFADAFMEGYVGNPLSADQIDHLPASIAAPLKSLLQPGIASTPRIVLAPLFKPGAPQLVIAGNFRWGLQALSNSGILSGNSSYIRDLSQKLLDFIQAAASGGATSLALPSATPSSPIENTIQQAVLLAFGK